MQRKIGNPLLEVKNVEIGFVVRGRYRRIVNNLNLVVHEGETLGLVGESGSGKTTIGRAIMRVNKIHSGSISFNGKRIDGKLSPTDLEYVHKNIQMIFQDPAASLNERATVDYIIAEGIDNYKEYSSQEDRREKILRVIESVGLLPEHLTRYPHEFSGGQRQRIGVARALIMKPKLVIADEPISALDVSIRAQVLNLLRDIQLKTGLSLLFIAHDLSVVRYISDRIAVISQGDIVEVAEAEELFKNPMHPYTKSLLNAIPQPDPLTEREKKLVTYDPSNADYSVNKPRLEEIVPGHFVFGNDEELAQYTKLLKK